MIDAKKIREKSAAEAVRLGYPINVHLPLLEVNDGLKNRNQATDRLLCLYAVVARSYGFPKEKAIDWLKREGLMEALADTEKRYLESKDNLVQKQTAQWQVEALWALAWCLGCHDLLDFSDSCDDNFIRLLPDLAKNESAEAFWRAPRELNRLL